MESGVVAFSWRTTRGETFCDPSEETPRGDVLLGTSIELDRGEDFLGTSVELVLKPIICYKHNVTFI